jgi:hypothetical protein
MAIKPGGLGQVQVEFRFGAIFFLLEMVIKLTGLDLVWVGFGFCTDG